MSPGWAYLGPQGTFTEAALRIALADLDASSAGPLSASTHPMPSVDAALAAVRAGEVDGAVVPIENSVEGGVPATLDALASGPDLRVVREVLVLITFVLAARAGTTLDQVRRIGTHPHAWAQCRGSMTSLVPAATYVPALSTAAAAESIADVRENGAVRQDDGGAPSSGLLADLPFEAALCSPLAAERFGLQVLAEDVGDNQAATTRFVLVARPGPVPSRTGSDKTSVVVFQSEDHPGGLLELLEQFAARGVNLTRIESRPTGDALGRYCFSIDCEGHIGEARVAEALMGLHRTSTRVRFLGSYPRADGAPAVVAPATTDDAFDRAGAWLAALRAGKQ